MTTLFNLFCPAYFFFTSVSPSVLGLCVAALSAATLALSPWGFYGLSGIGLSACLSGWLVVLLALNLISLVCFSYPMTTTLAFNFVAAVSLWASSVFVILGMPQSLSSILPKSTPSYLVAFLSVVELISSMIRPITLCFRLLANMSAGHILLSLVCKLSGFWGLGSPLGLLELVVCAVQAFVFSMLISVYLGEAFTH